MKGLPIMFLLLVLAGCGDFEWFPEDGTTTTTPTTPTQQTFDNNSTATATGPTMPTLPEPATGNQQVTTFDVVSNPSPTNVTLGFNLVAANLEMASATVEVTIFAEDATGAKILETKTTVAIEPNSYKTWHHDVVNPLTTADYDSIKAWKLSIVKQ